MNIQQVYEEGRLIRGEWSKTDADGRQLLCLYTALVGDPRARPGTCPAHLAPKWLAHLLPSMDDSGSESEWPGMVARVARLAPRFGRISPACEWLVRALIVREAMRHTKEAEALAVCERVAALCEKRGAGEVVDLEEMRSAAASAFDAYDAAYAAYAADAAASAAASAFDAYDAAYAAYDAAYAAAAAAYAAAANASAATYATYAAAAAARKASWDRMTAAILDVIEADHGTA